MPLCRVSFARFWLGSSAPLLLSSCTAAWFRFASLTVGRMIYNHSHNILRVRLRVPGSYNVHENNITSSLKYRVRGLQSIYVCAIVSGKDRTQQVAALRKLGVSGLNPRRMSFDDSLFKLSAHFNRVSSRRLSTVVVANVLIDTNIRIYEPIPFSPLCKNEIQFVVSESRYS